MGKKIKSTTETKVKEQHTTKQEPKIEIEGATPKQKKIAKKMKHNRIIIRNLVFDISEKHLNKLLAPYGKVKEISIPSNPDKKGSKGFAFIEFTNLRECQKAIKQLNGKLYKGRTIVVDMAVSKKNFMTEKLNHQSQQVAPQNQEQNQAQNTEIKEEIEEQEKEPVKVEPKQPKQQQNLDSTIFVRNLPSNVTQEQLYNFFRRYGKLKFAKVVMDKQKNISKGTAFVKFCDAEKAQQLIEYSRSYQMFVLKKHYNFQPNPAINLQIQGTIIKLFPVQTRTGIQQKIKARTQEQAEPTNTKKKPLKKIKRLEDLVEFDKDKKRNLYLGLLGNWRATEEMKEQDFSKFKDHQKQKVEKLKNPNNSISDTRIILKFLSKTITEQQIRELCFEYLDEFQIKRNNLTYCKLMLVENMTKSAGFAFVQFRSHEQAKKFIDWLCKDPSKLMPYPYVCEFAIQDSRKMQKLHKKIRKEKK